jgi:hypothetical protein
MKEWVLPVHYPSTDFVDRKDIRAQYAREQDGKCMWCKMPLDGEPCEQVRHMSIDKSLFPPTMFDHPIHLQHNHKTGLTEGAVHARCNAVMWQYHGR